MEINWTLGRCVPNGDEFLCKLIALKELQEKDKLWPTAMEGNKTLKAVLLFFILLFAIPCDEMSNKWQDAH